MSDSSILSSLAQPPMTSARFSLRASSRRRLVCRAARGEDVGRSAPDRAVAHGVGMDADEGVGAVVPGDLEPLLEGHVVIPRAGEKRPVPLALVQIVMELFRDLEDDVLLAGAHLPDGAGVFTAVARVDDDDPRLLELLDLLPAEALLLLDLGELQVDDDAVGLVQELLELEDLRLHILRQGQLDADALVGQGDDIDLFDTGLVQEALERHVLGQVGVLHGEGDPAAFLRHGIGRLVARVDDHPRVVRGGPVADVGDIDRDRRQGSPETPSGEGLRAGAF